MLKLAVCKKSRGTINDVDDDDGDNVTSNFQISRSLNHRIGVDLAHVPAPIRGLDSLDVEKPLVVGRSGE